MPNGDYIEGTFTGQWGDGIRINGSFHKLEATGPPNSPTRSVQGIFIYNCNNDCGMLLL